MKTFYKRKNLPILILFLTTPFFCFSQEKSSDWFIFETSVTGDFMKNLTGGINTDFTYIGMEEVAITLDLEAAGLWSGGEIFLHGLNSHGRSPSAEIVGDFQVTSNIEAGDYVGFYEYYLLQNFGNFSLLVGQHDLNSEFIGTEYGGTFINSSFGIAPSISLNIPVSIYPFAALSTILKYEIENKYAAKFGIYDGDPGDPESNRYNLQPNISLDEGLLFIGEFEKYHFVNDLPESYKLGAYYHTNSFQDYNDTLNSVRGNYGIYAISDMVLWSGFNHPHTYLGFFLQGGFAPSRINQINGYVGAGFHINGVLPKRFDDAMGIAVAYANVGSPFRNLFTGYEMNELAIELTYKIHVFDYYFIQPNLQYIINPGANSALNNAMVATIRFNVSLGN